MLLARKSRVCDDADAVVVIGNESTGKSQLISSLTGEYPQVSNFRGSTVSCEVYSCREQSFVDTPGILRESDTETTRLALSALERHESVLIVAQATHLDEDLTTLLPLAAGKRATVVVTFWDKLRPTAIHWNQLRQLTTTSGIPIVPVDARQVTAAERREILDAVRHPGLVRTEVPTMPAWRPPAALARERRRLHALVAALLIVLPSLIAVNAATALAGVVETSVGSALTAVTDVLGRYARGLGILDGRYGLLTMGPLMLIWSLPTVVLFALLMGVYKASGIVDYITAAIQPVAIRIGMTGRDLVRVMMGFGCNVPAVISTRACSGCSRGTCIATIAFGAACSYQLGATLAVFAALDRPALVAPFLGVLGLTTLIYARMVSTKEARSRRNLIVIDDRTMFQWPTASAVWREARGTIGHFVKKALPIFVVICLVASVLDRAGVIALGAGVLGPFMWLFNLPADTSAVVVLASIRKDAILLLAESKSAGLTNGQVLTAVYLSGVLVPCLVTTLTIAREQSSLFAMKLLGRQAVAAVTFSSLLAWGCAALHL